MSDDILTKQSDEPTISDVLEAVQTFAESVEERFRGVGERFDRVDERFDRVEGDIERLRSEMHDEFARLWREIDDIKQCLKRVEDRTKEDSDAAAGDILELRERVEAVEQQVRQLQMAR